MEASVGQESGVAKQTSVMEALAVVDPALMAVAWEASASVSQAWAEEVVACLDLPSIGLAFVAADQDRAA